MPEPTTILLVRHGMTDAVGQYLAGRSAGVHLTAEGRRQAEALARRISALSCAVIYSSPLERAVETAAPLAAATGLDIRVLEDAHEVDFGAWTGRRVAELERDPQWHAFNASRAMAAPPGGESLSDVQARMLRALRAIVRDHPAETAVVVSHADPIRAAVCGLAGIPLDFCLRVRIDPASVSTIAIWDAWIEVRGLNA